MTVGRELGPYAALDWVFTVRCDAPDFVADHVHRALQSLLAPERHATGQYALTVPPGGMGSVLEVDGRVLLRTHHPYHLFSRLLWHINVATVEASSAYTLLHAAAVEADGRAVVLPAPPESGKSTLAAGLVLSGLRYLTDETVALRPADLSIVPHPKALHLDRGSWAVLPELRPELPAEAEVLRGDQWQITPTSLGAVSSGATPALVVLPRYAAGARRQLTPLSPGEALLAVLQETFALHRQRRRDMEVLASLLSTVPAYRLVSGDLPSSVDAIRGLLT